MHLNDYIPEAQVAKQVCMLLTNNIPKAQEDKKARMPLRSNIPATQEASNSFDSYSQYPRSSEKTSSSLTQE